MLDTEYSVLIRNNILLLLTLSLALRESQSLARGHPLPLIGLIVTKMCHSTSALSRDQSLPTTEG